MPGRGGAIELLAVLAEHRHWLWRYPLFVTLVLTALSFLFPNTYRSQVTVLPPERDFQSVSQPLGELKGLFAGGMALPVMATPSDILAAVLTSRTVRDSVVARMNLTGRWHDPAGEASERLLRCTGVRVSPAGILEFWAEDRNPWFADTLANTMVTVADRINQSIVNTKASRTRQFVEQRLTETQAALDSASHALERFQNEHRTVALDVEVKAMIEGAATLKAQQTADEIDLSVLEESLAPDHPRIRALRTRIQETGNKLRDLDSPQSDDTARGFLGMGVAELPRLSQELAKLLRDVKVAGTLYELLNEQYENARIQERRDTPTFSVLDWAVGGGPKVRPKRAWIALGTLIAAFGLITILILVRAYLEKLALTDPAKHQSLVALWQSVAPSRRHAEGK
ncbi:MAG: hypothetical protein HY304_04100 [candidate division Zixibacteria bacterium]|nr:hypothetical protein [candidate division Zixibacteria bacterium]